MTTSAVPVTQELRAKVLDYAARHGGTVYAPIPHPDLADIPFGHGPERFEIIRPHIPANARTALDIGTHWGYVAHKLEDMGLQVTAAESSEEAVYFAEEIRKAAGKSFKVVAGSVLDLDPVRFDIVFALNIFHHFIKKEPVFKQFQAFLRRLDCDTMIFQAHHTGEGQMTGAFKNFTGEAFCDFIVAHSSLTEWTRIGEIRKRNIYKLTRSR